MALRTVMRVCRSTRLNRLRASPRTFRVCTSSRASCFCSAFHCPFNPAMRASLGTDCSGDPRKNSDAALCCKRSHRPSRSGDPRFKPGTRPRYNSRVTAITVTDDVRVPAAALTVRAVRASGPGGQNVNKVATKIDLRVELDRVEGLSAAARSRLDALARHRLDADGRLVVTSQATRNQARNLEDAREKVRALVASALIPPRPRTATRPSAQARERRLGEKRLRGGVKRLRARPSRDD